MTIPSHSRRFDVHRLSLAASLLLITGTALPAETPVEPAPKKRSFLDPIGDFARDSILHPKAHFELVPGKDPNGWAFVIEPYLWAMGISGTTGVSGMPPANVSVDAKKVLQQLDWGIMGTAEVRKGRWGLLVDGYYAELSGSSELGGVLYESGSMDIQQGLASLSLAYRIIDDRRGFLDVYAGARYNYLGVEVSGNTDSGGIQDLSSGMTGRIASSIDARVQESVQTIRSEVVSAVASAKQALAERLVESVEIKLADRVIERAAADVKTRVEHRLLKDLRERRLGPLDIGDRRRDSRREGIDPRRLEVLRRAFRADRTGAFADYIRAAVDLEVARARGEVTADLEQKAASAKAKASKQLASNIEEALPTQGSGEAWWVDPIIGLRGQVNFTRWLYLTAQADVGGFGAGSQITWNVIGALGVNFTRNVFAELGYRYMYVDYTSGSFLYQMSSYGIYSSLGFKF